MRAKATLDEDQASERGEKPLTSRLVRVMRYEHLEAGGGPQPIAP
jgi:hypothetical protein